MQQQQPQRNEERKKDERTGFSDLDSAQRKRAANNVSLIYGVIAHQNLIRSGMRASIERRQCIKSRAFLWAKVKRLPKPFPLELRAKTN